MNLFLLNMNSNRKHIVFLQRHLDSGNGGEERSLFSILKCLGEDKTIETSLFYFKIGDLNPKLPNSIKQFEILKTELSPNSFFVFFLSIIKAYRIIKKNKINHIHVNHYKDITWAACIKWITGIPLTVHLRLNAPTYLSRQYQWGLNKADGFIANSEFVKEDWLTYLSAKKIDVIYNGIDLNPNEISESSETVDLLFIGRIVQEKGLHLAIQALSYLTKNRTLTVIGDFKHSIDRGEHNYENTILNYIQELQLSNRVRFMGQFENPYPYIKKANLVIVPSYHDSFGRTFMEAWTLGTPAVASNCGGMIELVKKWPELNQYVFDEGNAVHLSEVIEKCSTINQPESFTFSMKQLIEQMTTFFNQF